MTHAAGSHIETSGWPHDRWIGPFYPPGTGPEAASNNRSCQDAQSSRGPTPA